MKKWQKLSLNHQISSNTHLISFANLNEMKQVSEAWSRIWTTVEPRCEKTGLWGFRRGPTQTGLYSQRRWLEAWNFGLRKQRDCTIHVAKTKALISFAVTAKLICAFVFAYAKSRFSPNEAQLLLTKGGVACTKNEVLGLRDIGFRPVHYANTPW